MHNEELHNTRIQPAQNIVIKIKLIRAKQFSYIASLAEMLNVHKMFVVKRERKVAFCRIMLRNDNYIKTTVKEVTRDCIGWIQLTQDRILRHTLVRTINGIQVPRKQFIWLVDLSVSTSRPEYWFNIARTGRK